MGASLLAVAKYIYISYTSSNQKVRKCGQTCTFTLKMRLMLRTAFTILYMNLTKPFKFPCQQKESQQIVNIDSDLNNTLIKQD